MNSAELKQLIEKKLSFSKVALGYLPTPLSPLKRFSQQLHGPEIWVKRDDLTGLAFGGNKTRKLEYIIGDAIEKGADCLITAGAIQSNHCRQTAAAAAYLGMDCHLLLGGEEHTVKNGNLLLDQLLGAYIHWCGENRKGETIPFLVEKLKKQGFSPYVIPYGGSNVYGALGYVDALCEVVSQINSFEFSHIVFASSSGGTHAGLMAAERILDLGCNILGINIDKASISGGCYSQDIIDLANQTMNQLQRAGGFSIKDLDLNDNYIGDGYAVVGELEKEAIALMAKFEGIILDPVYTGRALGGVIDMIRRGQLTSEDKVLFWHTGGTPSLFAYSDLF
jgi:D-cysteine desulfhydrase